MISVCIATHNGAHYIKEQIESILCQLGTNDEIIISDDGSNDKTIDILLAFNDKRIIYMYQEQPNVSNARNVGLENVTGKYVSFIDSDDRK